MEQTSSSAYPNVLVVDYIKKARVASPQLLMKSEQYLNVGYQKLLTFERPGGGFDWWGNGEPLVWLSAYGLQEFSDMSKVYPIDRGIIDRTQGFLIRKMDKDGCWSDIGATHGETIASMGNPKLLLTSYVVWSLLDSGLKGAELKPSIEYIRDHVKGEENAYILALAANALAAWDANDDSTLEVLKKYEFEETMGTAVIVREPVGVVGMITPWNWPLNQIACKVAPALAAGCTMILKPSEFTPTSALIFAEILHEAGVPKGVFNLLNGLGP